ncbi:hypothetical protein AB1Y20_016313 [Prymnesium parvum]|uniref:Uncharacterized protein n=1 Tax=Prymnesium parvum TaxID=97485 RepID=A0AB34ICY8_PRYPA
MRVSSPILTRVLYLLLSAATTQALLPPSRTSLNARYQLADRRSLLHTAAAALVGGFAGVRPGLALEDLDDIAAPSAGNAKPIQANPISLSVVTRDGSAKKVEKDSPYARIKELQQKSSLTDKEKKELRRLKADEMCEMLGRGC